MTDKHVDELLADLDRALAVEPSPSLAARVRTRIAEQTVAPAWFGSHWRSVLSISAAAVVIVAAYVAWPRVHDAPAPAATVALHQPDPPVVLSAAPQVEILSPPVARRTAPRRAAPVQIHTLVSVDREPEVLVSPSQRIALAQLVAGLRSGRVGEGALTSDGPVVLSDPIVIPSQVIAPFKVDPVPAVAGGNQIR